jgi:hypothetical protein
MHRRACRSAQPLDLMRTLIACFIAPLVVIVGLIPLDMLGLSHVGTGPSVSFSLVIYAIAVVITILVALPIRHASRRWHFSTSLVTAIAGFLAGVICFRIAAQVTVGEITSEPMGSIPGVTYLKFGILGAVSGLVFWAIAKPELRPNTSRERTRER